MEALGVVFLAMILVCMALVVMLAVALRANPSTIGQNARRFVTEHDNFFMEFLMPLWPFLIICIVAREILGQFMGDYAVGLILLLPESYLTAIFAIAWHRCVLQGADRKHRVNMWRPQKSETRFFITALLLGFATGAFVGVVSGVLSVLNVFLGWVVIVPSIAFAMYCWLRLSLVLPALAINRPISLAESRALTKGKTGQMFLAIVSAIWPAVLKIIVYLVVLAMFFETLNAEAVWVTHLRAILASLPVALYFNFQIVAGIATVLSAYYRNLINGGDVF